jgi:hypothetical protein
MPEVNLHESEELGDSSWELLPEGRYLCTCVSGEETTSRAGKTLWRLRYEVVTGPEGAPEQRFEGKGFNDDLYWTDKTLPRVKKALKSFGLDVDQNKTINWEISMVVGKAIIADVIIDESTYTSNEGEKKQWRGNKIDYAGFHAVEEEVRKQLQEQGVGEPVEDEAPF